MLSKQKLIELRQLIDEWATELGFQQAGVSDTDLDHEKQRFNDWLEKGYHGEMSWIGENKEKRLNPNQLVPETCRVISVRMNYLAENTDQIKILKSRDKAYISRYALGRDYHKLIRKRLAKLAEKIERFTSKHANFDGKLYQRPFVDSAPVLERPLAQKAGLGWVGKHTLVLNRAAGSWFFLGELFTNIPLPINKDIHENHCGECTACLKVCPTDAFTKPYELEAKRCISYLTIENKKSIPLEFREAIGNRVFGCDDCQAICPWNKYAKPTDEHDFHPRHGLESKDLVELFQWTEEQFLEKTAGSPIRRIGYELWQRNLAVGLGNSIPSSETIKTLENALEHASPLLSEHLEWAIDQLKNPKKIRQRKIKRELEPIKILN